jgi:DNA integrity scanning protein DisA with diadenylate cyclase activity
LSPERTEKKSASEHSPKKPPSRDKIDPGQKQRIRFNKAVVAAAKKIAGNVSAKSIFIIIDDLREFDSLVQLLQGPEFKIVVSGREAEDQARKSFATVVVIPEIKLSRLGKIKFSIMSAISKGMVQMGDRIVCLAGVKEFKTLDTMVVIEIGKEYEILSSQEAQNISSSVHPGVFEELVKIAVELAYQGREGKPLGTIFVLGDAERVMQISRQMIFNPFQGYPEEERNILDPSLRETIKEFSSLDGAFVIREDGVILAAGRYLSASMEDAGLPQGLGSRHAAAAGITAVTNAISIVISESTGDVRIFKNGKIFLEIEKENPQKAG